MESLYPVPEVQRLLACPQSRDAGIDDFGIPAALLQRLSESLRVGFIIVDPGAKRCKSWKASGGHPPLIFWQRAGREA